MSENYVSSALFSPLIDSYGNIQGMISKIGNSIDCSKSICLCKNSSTQRISFYFEINQHI